LKPAGYGRNWSNLGVDGCATAFFGWENFLNLKDFCEAF